MWLASKVKIKCLVVILHTSVTKITYSRSDGGLLLSHSICVCSQQDPFVGSSTGYQEENKQSWGGHENAKRHLSARTFLLLTIQPLCHHLNKREPMQYKIQR